MVPIVTKGSRTHHRIRVGDLLAYRVRRREGVRELARLSDEFGIDDGWGRAVAGGRPRCQRAHP